MEFRVLARTDLKLSLVGLGCNNFGSRTDYARSERVVRHALALGINHFDTADIYGGGESEGILGRALGDRRKDIVLATKFGLRASDDDRLPKGAAAYVVRAVEGSLKRLGTDWIDLLLMHVPDPSTPIEETLRALEDLRRAGKVRHAAASNFGAAEIASAHAAATTLGAEGFVACQDELSVLRRGNEKALLPEVKARNLGFLVYRPLAGGALSGKYRRGAALPAGSRYADQKARRERFLEPNWDRIEALRDYAEARGHTLLDLAMSWLARQPLVTSIVTGATSPEQLDASVGSTGWAISDVETAEIDSITKTRKRSRIGRLVSLLR